MDGKLKFVFLRGSSLAVVIFRIRAAHYVCLSVCVTKLIFLCFLELCLTKTTIPLPVVITTHTHTLATQKKQRTQQNIGGLYTHTKTIDPTFFFVLLNFLKNFFEFFFEFLFCFLTRLFNCFNSTEFRSPFELDFASKSLPEEACRTCRSRPVDVDGGCWSLLLLLRCCTSTLSSSSSGSTVTDVDSDLGDGPSFIVFRSYSTNHTRTRHDIGGWVGKFFWFCGFSVGGLNILKSSKNQLGKYNFFFVC